MPSPGRLTLAGLAVALLVGVVGTTVIPTHLNFGAGAFRCGTVLHPDRTSEVAAYCGAAGAHQLRAVLGVTGALSWLCVFPTIIERKLRDNCETALAVWCAVFAASALLALAWLGFAVEYSPPHPAGLRTGFGPAA